MLDTEGAQPQSGAGQKNHNGHSGSAQPETNAQQKNPAGQSSVMDAQEVLRAFQDTGAVRHGHFQLTSGRHSDTYIQCARVLEQPRLTMRLAEAAVAGLPAGLKTDLVAAPAIGGILFGFAVASVLDLPFVFSERKDGQMSLRRDFQVPPGARVLVAEDVVTTGGSVRELIDLIQDAGAEVCAVVALADRGGEKRFDQPFYPLAAIATPSWEAADCQLCQSGQPITAPGSRSLT